MDASTSVALQLVYIGKAANLGNRIGGRTRSYLNRIQGLPDPDDRTNLCPAEKAVVADGKQLKISFAETPEQEKWESELLRLYVACHGIKPGYRNIAGDWCRGNYRLEYAPSPNLLRLQWTNFEEYGLDLISGMTDRSGVYRVCI